MAIQHAARIDDGITPLAAVKPAEWMARNTETEVLELESAAIGDRLRVMVNPGEAGAPVLYVVDPVILFDLAVGVETLLRTAARFMGGAFPSLTVVGVGYPTDDPGAVFAARSRDLTPTDGAASTLFSLPPLPFGGASAFLEALATEVIPRVEQRYPSDPSRRALAGLSFGGLFALYTLFHRPDLFAGYVIGSPSLWWDDGIASRWEAAWAHEHRDLAARIFLSAAEYEQTVGDTWKNEGFPLDILQRAAEVDRVLAFAQRLRDRGYPHLHLDVAVFAGEYHLTAPPAMLGRGLLTLFEGTANAKVG